jgi:hypothetical protein
VYSWFGYHGFDRFFTVVCSGTVGFLAALSGVAPIQVFVEPGVSYQRALELARVPDGLDIKGFYRAGRPSGARLDIIPAISILEICGSGAC